MNSIDIKRYLAGAVALCLVCPSIILADDVMSEDDAEMGNSIESSMCQSYRDDLDAAHKAIEDAIDTQDEEHIRAVKSEQDPIIEELEGLIESEGCEY